MRKFLAVLVLLAAGVPAWAQSFPAKPVRIVVAFAPGGGTDIIARLVAQKLTERWGQAVVVDNKPGASGNIGADMVAKSAPDGYATLMAFCTRAMRRFPSCRSTSTRTSAPSRSSPRRRQ